MLLDRVDDALYEAKRAGRNRAYYDHRETAEPLRAPYA